jgi:hypothetical protein
MLKKSLKRQLKQAQESPTFTYPNNDYAYVSLNNYAEDFSFLLCMCMLLDIG